MSDKTSHSGKNNDAAGENIRSRSRRRFKRKCAYCGKWEYDRTKLILLPSSRTAVSESNSAHKVCHDEALRKREIKNLSNDEKNKIIVENLFGLKVIYPNDYYANLKGKNADYWRANRPEGDAPVIVKNNKELKTHWIDAMPVPDYYANFEISGIEASRAYTGKLLAQAYEKLMERDLFEEFARVLFENFSTDAVSADVFKTPEKLEKEIDKFPHHEQADAIILILLAEISE